MKDSITFEEQTEKIVEALLRVFLGENLPIFCLRQVSPPEFGPETAAGDATSTFDPVTIASRLEYIGDQYNRDLEQHVHMLATEMVEGKENLEN